MPTSSLCGSGLPTAKFAPRRALPRHRLRRHRIWAVVAVLVLGGCAGLWSGRAPLTDARLELTDTAFFPQQAYQCGPAALATVLDASGVPVHPDDLAPAVYLPERQGTLQVELLAAARRHGRLAVELQGGLPDIVRQLEAGRPVLVLQNLAVSFLPVWHYAVVVGYDPERDHFVLRSGSERREITRRARFEASWRRGGHWALVVLAPDAAPAGLTPREYLAAAADLENTGAHQHAVTAFRNALSAWPGEPLARLGEANNLYYLGRLEEAADAYRRLVERHPDQVVGVHNLVMLLIETGRPCEAKGVLENARHLEGSLMDTARRAVAAAAGPCAASADSGLSLD